MHGTIPPLLQYAFMAWCSVKKSTERTFTLRSHVTVVALKPELFKMVRGHLAPKAARPSTQVENSVAKIV
jgi:hypothetical protein